MNCPSCDSEHVYGSKGVVQLCDSCGYRESSGPAMRVKHVATVRHPVEVKEKLEPMMRDIADKHGIELDENMNVVEDYE